MTTATKQRKPVPVKVGERWAILEPASFPTQILHRKNDNGDPVLFRSRDDVRAYLRAEREQKQKQQQQQPQQHRYAGAE